MFGNCNCASECDIDQIVLSEKDECNYWCNWNKLNWIVIWMIQTTRLPTANTMSGQYGQMQSMNSASSKWKSQFIFIRSLPNILPNWECEIEFSFDFIICVIIATTATTRPAVRRRISHVYKRRLNGGQWQNNQINLRSKFRIFEFDFCFILAHNTVSMTFHTFMLSLSSWQSPMKYQLTPHFVLVQTQFLDAIANHVVVATEFCSWTINHYWIRNSFLLQNVQTAITIVLC